jgi:hypothetical protein
MREPWVRDMRVGDENNMSGGMTRGLAKLCIGEAATGE